MRIMRACLSVLAVLAVLGLLLTAACGTLWDGFAKSCQRNADCPSEVCVDVLLGSYEPGSCVPTEAVLYVDWDHCGMGAQNGTLGSPFCEVQNAIATIPVHDTQLHIFQVKPSTHQYAGVTIAQGNVALLGPWADPKLKGTQWDQEAAAILLGSDDAKSRIGLAIRIDANEAVAAVVDGLAIRAINTGLGVNVENLGHGSTLTLRRTTVSGSSGYGIAVGNPGPATFTIDRCQVKDNAQGGLVLGSEVNMFAITNSLFIGNGLKDGAAAAVSLNGRVEGIFDQNTVTQNSLGKNAAGGIECNRAQSITNSIVLGNASSSGSQFLPNGSNNCQLHNTIVEDEETQGGLKCNLRLTADAQLAAGLSLCAIDKSTDNPDRNLDYFGTRRPQGAHSDIGFHELVKP